MYSRDAVIVLAVVSVFCGIAVEAYESDSFGGLVLHPIAVITHSTTKVGVPGVETYLMVIRANYAQAAFGRLYELGYYCLRVFETYLFKVFAQLIVQVAEGIGCAYLVVIAVVLCPIGDLIQQGSEVLVYICHGLRTRGVLCADEQEEEQGCF
jgi:hypothetical protein